MKKNLELALIGLTSLLLFTGNAYSIIYSAKKDLFWDPSIIYHDGKFHLFAMQWGNYETRTNRKSGWVGCLYSTSKDGVHWEKGKVILKEREEEAFFKPFVFKCGDRFVMNHGVRRYDEDGKLKYQDVLRFYESEDLTNWTYVKSTQPDKRWYKPYGDPNARWDHMYVIPKQENNPEAGYWGYVVSLSELDYNLPGMMESEDGLNWKVLPPAKAEWGNVKKRKYFEYGGVERIKDKYYLIGGGKSHVGTGYAMLTFVSDGPTGVFRPDEKAYRLCGTTNKMPAIKFQSWLAAWARALGVRS